MNRVSKYRILIKYNFENQFYNDYSNNLIYWREYSKLNLGT